MVRLITRGVRRQWVVSQCSGTILDIGSCQGHIFRDTGLDVTLLDINEFEPCEFPQVIADAHSLPFKDNSFDCCFLGEILEHVHNPILVLREAVRVARKKVNFTVPDEFHWPLKLEPFYTLDDRLKEAKAKGLSIMDMVRKGNPTLTRLIDLRQLYHSRWYTEQLLRSHLDFLNLPYQIETVRNNDGWSWFCGTIIKDGR